MEALFEGKTVAAVLLAAGESRRFGRDKLTAPLGGKTVVEWAARAVFSPPWVDRRIAVAAPERVEELRGLLAGAFPDAEVIPGGKTRCRSSLLGLEAAGTELVLVHDGARPLLDRGTAERCLAAAAAEGACAAAVRAADTVKVTDGEGRVLRTTPRKDTWQVQSPQAFRRELILDAYGKADQDDPGLTDDCMAAERAGYPVFLVEGDRANLKITAPGDLELAKALGPALGLWKEEAPMFRTGIGQDSHRMSPPGTPGTMVLGGVPFPEYPPLLANSDGDVVLHALCNAISGVSCENILGERADRICQSGVTDSAVYVGEALKYLTGRVVHVSFTIECREPKITPRIPAMRRRIGELLGLPPERVGITATSGEGLTGFGRGEGVSVFCVATVEG